MEIQRIQSLADMVHTEKEKREILNTIDVFSDVFQTMIRGAGRFMLGEKDATKADLSPAMAALLLLHDRGVKYGMEFPEANTERDVAAYVIQFGQEIIKQG